MALVRDVTFDSVDFEDLHDFPDGETDAYVCRTHDVLLARPVATNQPTRLSIIDHDEQEDVDLFFGSVELVLEEYSERLVEQAMQPMLADMFWDFSWFQFNGFTRRCFTSTSWLRASWGRVPLRQWHSCGHVYPRSRVCRRLGGPTGFILPRRGGRRDVESVPVHPSSGRTNSSSMRSMSRRLC